LGIEIPKQRASNYKCDISSGQTLEPEVIEIQKLLRLLLAVGNRIQPKIRGMAVCLLRALLVQPRPSAIAIAPQHG